jgi:hypothetical protein
MLQGIIQNRYVKWIPFILAILAGCVGSVLGWMLVPELRITSMVFGFLVGFAFISLFIELLTSFFNSLTESTSQQLNHLVDHVYGVEQELQSMINIRPLLKDSLVEFGKWAIDGPFAEQLILKLKETRRHPDSSGLIVECGSGTSTVLIAHYLKQLGSGRLLSMEHEKEFAAATRESLSEAGVDDLVTILEVPLRTWEINGKEFLWYDIDPETFLQQSFDLLIVDGPPGKTGPLARYPAVPLLKKWLHPGSMIILDDGYRDDEKIIAEKWAGELNANLEFYSAGNGIWTLHSIKPIQGSRSLIE